MDRINIFGQEQLDNFYYLVHLCQTYFIPVLLLIFGETYDSECGELYEIIYGEQFSRVCGGIFDVEYCEVYEKKLFI